MLGEEVTFQFGVPEFGILVLVLALVYGISYLWRAIGAGGPPTAGARRRARDTADADPASPSPDPGGEPPDGGGEAAG